MLNRFLIPSSPLLAGLLSLPSYLGFLNTPLPTVPPTYSPSLISNSRHYLWKKPVNPLKQSCVSEQAAVVWPESSFQEHAGREKTACQTSLIREQEAPHILLAQACKSGYATLCWSTRERERQPDSKIIIIKEAAIFFLQIQPIHYSLPLPPLTSRQEFLWVILPSGFLFSY